MPMPKTTDIRSLMRPHLLDMEPYQGIDPPELLAQRAGIPEERIVKLNGNENPYGPSPRVAEALARYTTYHIYPDPQQRRAREALAEYAGTSPERVVAGVGSDELIDLLMRLFLEPGDGVVLCTPTFGMYETFAQVNKVAVVEVPLDERFEIDVSGVREAARRGAKMAFIASPNNPTGNLVSEETVRQLLDTGMLVVVDEAYYEFSCSTVLPLMSEYPNLVVLRTLSKWAGLASLRLGYGVMDTAVSERLMTIKPPYNITVASELALYASLEDRELLLSRVKALVQAREELFGELARLKALVPVPSSANFILCRCAPGNGKWLYDELATRGVFVRYYGTAPLQDCIRISVGLPAENQALLSALEAILS